MKESVVRKLEHLVERFEEVQALLGDPGLELSAIRISFATCQKSSVS